MNTLIIGGTTGMGKELAFKYVEDGDEVTVTGRRTVEFDGVGSLVLDLNSPSLDSDISSALEGLGPVERLVYSAGFYQEGRITDLTNEQIESMLNVGERGLIYLMRAVLRKQEALKQLIVITSSSQYTPRQKEPVYNMVKSGAAMFARAMAVDGRVEQTLLVAPQGMRTEFWDGQARDDLDQMLDPVWVADQIVKLGESESQKAFSYTQINRNPARVEIIEQ